MNGKMLVLALVVSVFLIGCTQSQNGYAAYNQPQGQQNNQYVGGGCGVAPDAEYSDIASDVLSPEDSAF